MGVGSILKGKEIVLLAYGENKADAIKGMIDGPCNNRYASQVHYKITTMSSLLSMMQLEANYKQTFQKLKEGVANVLSRTLFFLPEISLFFCFHLLNMIY